MKQRPVLASSLGLLALLLSLLSSSLYQRGALAQGNAPGAPLPQPTNMACMGWEKTTVVITFKDNATDENNYRVERSDNGGAWSEIATISPDSNGNYRYDDKGVDVSNQGHRYRVRAYRSSDTSFSPYSALCNNRRIYEPNKFRIFYGLRGTSDDCPTIDGNNACLADVSSGGKNVYVDQQNNSLQGSADAFGRLGFAKRADQPFGSLDKIPINIVWCDGGGCAGGGGLGLSPYLVEMPFNLSTRAGDPVAYMVPLHELWHFLQGKYGGLKDPAGGWVIEGQARSIQDKVCIGGNRSTALCFDDIATGYAGYVPEVKGYLGSPNWPINNKDYQAALFWTYLTEKFGTENTGDTVEIGMDFMRRFWESSNTTPNRDGITIINSVLAGLGRSERFRDVWKDFAVASYAKDYNGVAKYKYADVGQTGGNYGAPMLSKSLNLNLGDSILDTDESVYNWGANYYELRPATNVPYIDIKITQDTSTNVYYTVLGIKGSNIVYEKNQESRNLNLSLLNNAYDKVAIVVAGLENIGNYRLAINGTQPTLNILRPTTGNYARVGSPSAPDKFMVQVEVVAADGTPMTGVDLSQFSFKVGSVDVPAGNILSSAILMGQEWFVLRAPTQSAAGKYNLVVNYSGGTLTDTETNAVDYTPRADADSMVTLDRSGSMGDYGKMDAAKGASRLFVDSWRSGDKIGLVTFANAVTLDKGLVDWSDAERADMFTKINALTPAGGTRIGDSIIKSWDELKAKGNSSHDWAIVLVSDGLETDPGTKTFDQAVQALVDATGKKPSISSVAIGPDSDRIRMQNAASRTGGTYQYVSSPTAADYFLTPDVLPGLQLPSGYPVDPATFQQFLVQATANPPMPAAPDASPAALPPASPAWVGPAQLPPAVPAIGAPTPTLPTDLANFNLRMDYRYRAVATDIIGQQQFFALTGPLEDDFTYYDYFTMTVESGAAELIASLSWDPATGEIAPEGVELTDPNGTPYGPFEQDTRHMIWRIPTPMGGNWHWMISAFPPGVATPDQGHLADYLVQAALKSEVTMEVFITNDPAERTTGTPIHLLMSLTDVAPIAGGVGLAGIETPSGAFYYVWLWDDGLHDDGVAGDGMYGGTFYQTGEDGSYNATVLGYGYSSYLGEYFLREKVLSFNMDGGGDSDGDGLPDNWEIHFGLDPHDPNDAWGDRDGDSWPNIYEWVFGTDPNNPDSDGGGEGDGTDVFPGDPNPSDPGDDIPVEAPWGQAYPGVGKVNVKYTARLEYAVTVLYRRDDPSGPFNYYIEDWINAGVYTDTLVTNGQEYCYRLISYTIDGANNYHQSPTSPVTCATPNVDPQPPHGGVTINGGAAVTLSPHVTLDLWASDTVDPESELPFDEQFPPPGDSASGVTDMLISNDPSFAGANWEPYATSKPWTLATYPGLAAVYVRYRDAYANESDTYTATIWAGGGPGMWPVYLPLIQR